MNRRDLFLGSSALVLAAALPAQASPIYTGVDLATHSDITAYAVFRDDRIIWCGTPYEFDRQWRQLFCEDKLLDEPPPAPDSLDVDDVE